MSTVMPWARCAVVAYAELDVLAHVAGGQGDRGRAGPAGVVEQPDGRGTPSRCDPVDLPALPVADEPVRQPAPPARGRLVPSGRVRSMRRVTITVAAPDGQPVAQTGRCAVSSTVPAATRSARARSFSVRTVSWSAAMSTLDRPARVSVEPGGVGGVGHLVLVAGVDPPVLLVVAERRSGSPTRRRAAACSSQVRRVPSGSVNRRTTVSVGGSGRRGAEQGEGAAGLDRGELAGVADQQQLRAGVLGLLGERGEGEGAGHAGLVDDQQLPGSRSRHRSYSARASARRGVAARWCRVRRGRPGLAAR